MNKLESTIYNLVRKNPALKQFVRNMYQDIFDLLPRKKEYFASPYQYREGFFFGFHDVTPFSFDETKLLANQNRLDLRMPLPSDGLDVGYFDLEQGSIKDFHRVDTSYAWNYHKGCRLQWLDKNRMIYNTAIANRLVSKIHDLSTGEYQVIDCPIDAVYQDEQRSLASSFSYERLERCMPGYGYPYRDGGKLDDPAPKDSGLFLVDLKENTSELLISLSELAQMEDESYRQGYMHFVTHSEFSKDGRYLSFLYRKIPIDGDYMRRHTKIMVYDLRDRRLITLPTQESGSHYVWNNRNQLIASCIINGNSCHVLYDMKDVAHYQIIVWMLVLFPTFYSALLPVVDSVDKQMLEAAEVYGANGWQKIVYVYMPYMRNAVIENALSGISLAIKLIVSAEVISQAARSIGMMMQDSRMYLQSDRLIALTLVIVFICILIDGVGKLVCSGLKKPNKE